MANGDKDDKKKRNVRTLRPQGSGATTSLGEVAEGTRKFFTKTVPAAGKAVGTATVEAFQPSVVPTGPVVDFQSALRERTEDKEDGETYEKIKTELDRRTAGGRAKDDSDDFTPKPKFFGSMGESETGRFSPERQEAARLKAFGDPAFDSDGDERVSASERREGREERIRGYKESTERNKAKLAEIEARRLATAYDQRKLKEDTTPKPVDVTAQVERLAEQLDKKDQIAKRRAKEIEGLDVGGLREKDFASREAFVSAVKERNDPNRRPLGSGSSLRQTPRELGRLSGAMDRAGRKLIRKGAAAQGFAMFGKAATQRSDEGSAISTPERLAREEEERRQRINLIGATQQRMRDYQNLRNQMGTSL
tara:strand:- start:2645 stop:3739 length:1095 start_codon:yes stop_codon:yes gene_type:complete